MKTLAFRRSSKAASPYLVLLHTASKPDAAEWTRYVATVSATLAAHRGTMHVFIATDGGGPDASQRKELAQVVANSSAEALSHIFTTDAFIRGIVTAFRWISKARAAAHLPSDLAAVCAELGHASKDVLDDFALVQKTLPTVRTLAIIEKAFCASDVKKVWRAA